MEDPEPPYRHTLEDTSGILGAQVFGLLASALSALLFGSAYRGAIAELGFPVTVPFGGLVMVPIGGFALGCALSLPGRYRHVWDEPAARGWIITGWLQALITALIVGGAGLLVVGGAVDLFTTGQKILSWAAYGLIIGCLMQVLAVVVGFGFLILKRELPDGVD